MIKLGLRTKFFLFSNSLIVVTMSMVAVIAVIHERRVQNEAIIARGQSLIEVLAIPVREKLGDREVDENGRRDLIEAHFVEVLESNGDLLRYLAVVTADGSVIIGSDPDVRLRRFELNPESRDLVRSFSVQGRGFLEMLTMLDSPGAAALVLGFSLDAIEDKVRGVARWIVIAGLALMFFNSLLTATYVETLIRPILKLNQTMKRASGGDLSVRAPVRRGDEVGELSDAFNLMMDELEDAREREKVQRAQLAHTEKMAAVGTLAAGVAHEVNNPLAGVLACIENIRANPEDEAMRDQYIELIRDGLKRIERTVANLLDFSRPREVRLEPSSLNHSIRHVVELVGYQLRSAQVTVDFDLDPGRALIMADHFQAEQLLLNLVLNAMQAMPDGGTLSLSTRRRRDKVIVEVTDTGVGISSEDRERIFDPFFTTREVGEGTGLGLTVSDSILAVHGGSMEVQSTVGEGSTFRLIFDAIPSPPEKGGGLT
ncbi:MAG: HAMP domain-containing protein [bacterium]|nr:HAMP domain-containing protein [bacterium]